MSAALRISMCSPGLFSMARSFTEAPIAWTPARGSGYSTRGTQFQMTPSRIQLILLGFFRGLGERPCGVATGSPQVHGHTRNGDDKGSDNLSPGMGPRSQHEQKAERCQNDRERIEPDAEGPRHIWPSSPQEHHAHLLEQKLQHNAQGHQRGDDRLQVEEAAD